MKNKNIPYLLYLIVLHCACIFLTVSKFLYPKWGEWLVNTSFLFSPFSVYMVMIIAIFPCLSILPYYFQHDFPNVPAKKKAILAALLVGNTALILMYTMVITNMMSVG